VDINNRTVFIHTKGVNWCSPPNSTVFHEEMEHWCPVSDRSNPKDNDWELEVMAFFLVGKEVTSYKTTNWGDISV
jgi:hypothetical protein